MTWVLEVKAGGSWQQVRPSGGEPYQFVTEEEADAARRLCYVGDHGWPSHLQISRVREVQNG